MEDIFNWIVDTFPNLEVRIAWNQPMFTHKGTFIIGFSAAKNHISVAPEEVTIEKFKDQIIGAGYSHTKGLFRIPWNSEVDYKLLQDLIQFNIQDKAGYTKFWR